MVYIFQFGVFFSAFAVISITPCPVQKMMDLFCVANTYDLFFPPFWAFLDFLGVSSALAIFLSDHGPRSQHQLLL